MGEKPKTASPQLPGPTNLAFVENLYEQFVRDPSSVPADWQRYFSELGDGELRFPKPRFTPSFKPFSIFNPPTGVESRPARGTAPGASGAAIQDRIYLLIRLYRVRGHRIAQVDPLGLPQPTPPELEPEFFGFSESDMQLPVFSETFQYDGALTLRSLL